MSYAKNAKIESVDFNTLIGISPSSTANTVNTTWAVGNGNKGYGQTVIGNVSSGGSVVANDWANLVNTTANVGLHQATTLSSVTTPVAGARIDYNSNIVTNINSIYANRLSAASQGTTASTTTTRATVWSSAITFTHTVTFESGDKARYFFNAGGQLSLQFSAVTGGGVGSLFSTLATACGTVYLSAPTSGSITIGGTSFNGVTKVGGTDTPTTLLTNTGYYALTTSNQEIFKQLASVGPSGYTSSFISINAKTNSPVGSNGDNGNTITFTTLWDEIPNGLQVPANTSTILVVRPPSTTRLTQSWGTISVVGGVTGS